MTLLKDEIDPWSLEDHLRHGEDAILKIMAIDGIETIVPVVCFHFEPTEWNEDEPWGNKASFNVAAKPLFEALPFTLQVDYVGGTSGIEAWDRVMPTSEWLRDRMPELYELALKANLNFAGWSFEPREPRDFSFITCGAKLHVVNRYSPEGQQAFDELLAETEPKA